MRLPDKKVLLKSDYLRKEAELYIDYISHGEKLEKNLFMCKSLREINEGIYQAFDYSQQTTQVDSPIDTALGARRGVCQDFAHIMLAILRGIGIPARYVSGYLYPRLDGAIGDTSAGQSHAWVEWWSGDWSAFDPTNGVVPGLGHVLVARGRDYDDVTPLKGVYHGAASTGLGVTVEITRLA